jgi:hypothetical protein
MNPFTAHPYHRGISYLDLWCFAMGIAFRLFASVLAFAMHAIRPFIPIDPQLDLESTAAFLAERNTWIETAETTAVTGRTGIAASDGIPSV